MRALFAALMLAAAPCFAQSEYPVPPDPVEEPARPAPGAALTLTCGGDVYGFSLGRDSRHATLTQNGAPLAALQAGEAQTYSGGGWRVRFEGPGASVTSPNGAPKPCGVR
jgi:hypothetical protein